MIHRTNIYQIEYEKYLFFRRIKIFLLSFILILTGVICLKILTHGANELKKDYLAGDFKYTIYNDGTATVTQYTGSSDSITIPETVSYNSKDYDVTAIAEKAFQSKNMSSVTGESIKIIYNNSDPKNENGNEGAFKSCSNLTTVNFPNLAYLGAGTFYACKALKNVNMDNLIYGCREAFRDCESLETLSLPKVQYLASCRNCKKMTSVNLPELTYLGHQAFKHCDNLTKLSLPKLRYFGKEALNFEGENHTSVLTEINVPNLIAFDEDAFKNFSSSSNPNCYLPKSMANYNLSSLNNYSKINFKFEYDAPAPTEIIVKNKSELDTKLQEIKNKLDKEYNLSKYNINLEIKTPDSVSSYKVNSDRDSEYFIYGMEPGNYIQSALSGFGDKRYILAMLAQVDVDINKDVDNVEYDGQEHRPTVTASDGDYNLVENTDYEITGDFINAGKTVTLKFIGTYKGMDDISKESNITPKYASNFEVTPTATSHIYDDNVWNPEFVIKDNELNKNLVLGTDYNIELDSNMKDAGTKNIKINYIGNYTGEKDIQLEITPKDASDFEPNYEQTHIYDGNNWNPEFIIKDNELNKNLVLGTDYNIELDPNMKDAGSKNIKINYINNYTGEKDIQLKITPKDASNFEPNYEQTHIYNGNDWNPEFVIKDNELNKNLVLGTDYNIELDSNMKDAGTKNIKINYIGNYTGEKDIQLEITPKDASNFEPNYEQTHVYDGNVWNPEFIIKDNELNKNLVFGTDYNIELDSNMKDTGTKNIKINYINNYYGEKDIQLKITPKDASNFEPNYEQTHIYNGNDWNPEFIIKDNELNKNLVFGTDYNIELDSNMKDAGSKNIKINYINNYTGEKSIQLEITPKNASSFEPNYEQTHIYDGNDWNPEFIIKDNELNKNLVLGTDYNIELDSNMKDAGTKNIKINYINNYYGEKSIQLEITPKDASNFEPNYEQTHIYNGNDWNPEFIIKDNELNKNLVLGTDYNIELDSNMKDTGTKNIKINYINNYYGEKDIQLEIVVDKSDWGEEINNNGVINYVDESGKTSAEITGNEKIWLKETSDGTSAWYAVDNSDGVFKQGSRFWVEWLSPENNKKKFEEYYNKLDEEHKKRVKNNKLWIFLTGVTDPDGKNYTNLQGNINFYVQLSEDWDKKDIKAVFIDDYKDDVLDVSYENVKFPEGNTEFAKLTMEHFSPYAVYDSEATGETNNETNNEINNEIGNPNEKLIGEISNKPNETTSSATLDNKIINNKDQINNNNTQNQSKNKSKQDGLQYNVDSGLIIKISILSLIILISISSAIIFNKSKFKKNK